MANASNELVVCQAVEDSTYGPLLVVLNANLYTEHRIAAAQQEGSSWTPETDSNKQTWEWSQ